MTKTVIITKMAAAIVLASVAAGLAGSPAQAGWGTGRGGCPRSGGQQQLHCLVKEYPQAGVVVFRDICTKESATYTNLPQQTSQAVLPPTQ